MYLIDAEEVFESQDQRIFHIADRNNKGIIILVNKWDLIDKSTETAKEFEEKIKDKLAPFTDTNTVYISFGQNRLLKSLEKTIEVFKNRKQKIKTSLLNEVMLKAIEKYPPPAHKGKYIKIKYCTQLTSQSPSFVFFANLPQYIKEPYKRYLENQLRSVFNLKEFR